LDITKKSKNEENENDLFEQFERKIIDIKDSK
jgi:hypothetical protein